MSTHIIGTTAHILDYARDRGYLKGVSAVVGVNPGFNASTFTIKTPFAAAKRVEQELEALNIQAKVYPGFALYPKDRGCPEGGEVMGHVFTADRRDILKLMETLRKNLKQETVSVITAPTRDEVTPGFKVKLACRDLYETARKWQEIAGEKYASSMYHQHVSAAVYAENGVIYIQAEANPKRIKDMSAWESDAKAIIKEIDRKAKPVFTQVGYHYLR